MKDKIQKRIITKESLKKRSFYIKAKLLNWARIKDTRLKASKKMNDMVIDLNLQALQGEKPMVLTAIWAPSEILYALDLIPINLETTAASLANLKLSDQFLAVAEKNFHPPETCSILRCAVGAVLDELFPQPAAVIATSHLCDAGAKMIYMASKVYGCPYFLIDVPHDGGEEAIAYVAQQLAEMASELSQITGHKLDREKLAQAVHLSNQARHYALEANELRQAVPSPMRGSEALGYLYLIGIGFGSKQALEIYRSMAEELKKHTTRKYSPLGEEKYRLLWLHVKPYFQNRFFHYLEKERQVAIAFEEMNYIAWPELDPSQPFKSVARRLIFNLANRNLAFYTKTLLDLAHQYKVDGVIHYAHWGCRWNYGRTRIIKEAFQKKGIPFITIDCDSVSERNFFEGQLINQLDSFLDMLA